MSAEYSLELEGIVKRFPALVAVDHVNLQIAPGTIHAICGENGAGKSTLMRILAGEYPDYEGSIRIRGEQVRLKSPLQAKRQGIEIIHQELGLARPISVGENILAGRLPRHGRSILLNKRAADAQARKYLDLVGLGHVRPGALVSSLSQHEAQLVEIAKALSNEPSILIMDEPTSSLTRDEVELLFGIMARLKAQGLSIIYISHFLNEVFEVSDVITTMRDGRVISTERTERLTQQRVVREMIGRDVQDIYAARERAQGGPVLKVDRLTRYGFFRDVSFELREGEVLGVCGLAGAGRSELARALVGIDRWDSGSVEYLGEPLKNRGYAHAIRKKIAYLTEDRKLQGLALDQSIAANIASARSVGMRGGRTARRDADGEIESLMERLKVIPNDPGKIVGRLSGGNQQKVLLAKWLNIHPKLLILDEPTRGVDVGAKEMIHRTVREYAGQGNAVLLISSDLMELIGLSDRILILNHGRVHSILEKSECTEESLLIAANGGVNVEK